MVLWHECTGPRIGTSGQGLPQLRLVEPLHGFLCPVSTALMSGTCPMSHIAAAAEMLHLSLALSLELSHQSAATKHTAISLCAWTYKTVQEPDKSRLQGPHVRRLHVLS